MRQRKNGRPRHEGAHSWWGGDRRAWRWRPNHENIERKQEHCGGRIVVESDAAELWRDGIHAGCGIPDYSGEPERDGSAGGEELCAAGRCAGENRHRQCVPAGGGCGFRGEERGSNRSVGRLDAEGNGERRGGGEGAWGGAGGDRGCMHLGGASEESWRAEAIGESQFGRTWRPARGWRAGFLISGDKKRSRKKI